MSKETLELRRILGAALERNHFSFQGQTEFTVKLFVPTYSVPKAQWLRQQLPKWADLVSSQKEVISVDFSSKVTPGYPVNFPFPNQGITLYLRIQLTGSIIRGRAPKAAQRWISGQVKRSLAMCVLESFPPPFELEDVPLPAGTIDILEIKWHSSLDSHLWPSCRKDNLPCLIEHLTKSINKAGGLYLDYSVRTENKKPGGGINFFLVKIIWNNDIKDKSRCGIVDDLNELLFSLNDQAFEISWKIN